MSTLKGKFLKTLLSLLPGKVWRSAPTKYAMAASIHNWIQACISRSIQLRNDFHGK